MCSPGINSPANIRPVRGIGCHGEVDEQPVAEGLAGARECAPDQVDRRDHQLIVLSAALLVAPTNQAEQQAPGVESSSDWSSPGQRSQGQAEEQRSRRPSGECSGSARRGGNRGREAVMQITWPCRWRCLRSDRQNRTAERALFPDDGAHPFDVFAHGAAVLPWEAAERKPAFSLAMPSVQSRKPPGRSNSDQATACGERRTELRQRRRLPVLLRWRQPLTTAQGWRGSSSCPSGTLQGPGYAQARSYQLLRLGSVRQPGRAPPPQGEGAVLQGGGRYGATALDRRRRSGSEDPVRRSGRMTAPMSWRCSGPQQVGQLHHRRGEEVRRGLSSRTCRTRPRCSMRRYRGARVIAASHWITNVITIIIQCDDIVPNQRIVGMRYKPEQKQATRALLLSKAAPLVKRQASPAPA